MERLQPWILCAAFWLAVWGGRRAGPRLLAGLALGGLLAHAGWLLLHLDRWMAAIAELPGAGLPLLVRGALDPLRGHSLLFLPLGLLVVMRAPGMRCGATSVQMAAAFRALVPALAVARVGCLTSGCCHGLPTDLPWAMPLAGEGGRVHPVPLYEILCWLLLAAALGRLPERLVAPFFMIGFGATRLIVEPWRAPPPLGEPWIPVQLVAAIWVAAGICWWWGESRGGAGLR
jgi:prolipoprotein diacylglyceryltransferase